MGFKEKLKAVEDFLYSPENSERFWKILELFALLFVAFLVGGGIYSTYQKAPFVYYTSSGVYYYFPSSTSQVGAEVVIVGLLVLLGTVGTFEFVKGVNAIKENYMHAYYLFIGAALVAISLIGLIGLGAAKRFLPAGTRGSRSQTYV